MTVYTGNTFQTCALRVWGIWVSMRDLHTATVRYNRELLASSAQPSVFPLMQSEVAAEFRRARQIPLDVISDKDTFVW